MSKAEAHLVIVVMGVSGAGKTNVGKALARRCGCLFMDGDALHPPANIQKMKSGKPLDDADRAPWLENVRGWIDARLSEGRCGVISCSALKRRYRAELSSGRGDVRLVLLDGPKALLMSRLAGRKGHFMPISLLDSQLAALEPPEDGEDIMVVDITPPVDRIVSEIVSGLGLAQHALRPRRPGPQPR
jgi:gluconokinase